MKNLCGSEVTTSRVSRAALAGSRSALLAQVTAAGIDARVRAEQARLDKVLVSERCPPPCLQGA